MEETIGPEHYLSFFAYFRRGELNDHMLKVLLDLQTLDGASLKIEKTKNGVLVNFSLSIPNPEDQILSGLISSLEVLKNSLPQAPQ